MAMGGNKTDNLLQRDQAGGAAAAEASSAPNCFTSLTEPALAPVFWNHLRDGLCRQALR